MKFKIGDQVKVRQDKTHLFPKLATELTFEVLDVGYGTWGHEVIYISPIYKDSNKVRDRASQYVARNFRLVETRSHHSDSYEIKNGHVQSTHEENMDRQVNPYGSTKPTPTEKYVHDLVSPTQQAEPTHSDSYVILNYGLDLIDECLSLDEAVRRIEQESADDEKDSIYHIYKLVKTAKMKRKIDWS